MALARMFGVGAVVALAMSMLVQVGEIKAQARPAGIAGSGEWSEGGPDPSSLMVSATLLPNGSAVGYSRASFTYAVPPNAIGPVVQVVPPSAAIDYWCINVRLTNIDPSYGDVRTNWYIRDIGDGRTSFDEIANHAPWDVGVDCITFPTVGGPLRPIQSGNFRAH